MGNYTNFWMFENPRRGRLARNFTTNVPKILDSNRLPNRYFAKIDIECLYYLARPTKTAMPQATRNSTSITQASIPSLIWISIFVFYLLIISLLCSLKANNISTRLTTLSSLCE